MTIDDDHNQHNKTQSSTINKPKKRKLGKSKCLQ